MSCFVSGTCGEFGPNLQVLSLVSNVELENKIKNFFNDNEFDAQEESSEEENFCEKHF